MIDVIVVEDFRREGHETLIIVEIDYYFFWIFDGF